MKHYMTIDGKGNIKEFSSLKEAIKASSYFEGFNISRIDGVIAELTNLGVDEGNRIPFGVGTIDEVTIYKV